MKVYLAIVGLGMVIAGAPATAQVSYSQEECDQIMRNCNTQAQDAGGSREVYDACIADYGAQECRTADGEPDTSGGPRQYFPGGPPGGCNTASTRLC